MGRWWIAFLLPLVVAWGCQTGRPTAPPPTPSPEPTPTPQATPAPTPPPDASSLLPPPSEEELSRLQQIKQVMGWKTDLTRRTVRLDDILFGGVVRDGIPPIYEPKFESVAEADKWLDPFEPVLAFQWNGDARAYPIQMLILHEVVNDTVGGKPVVITY